MCCAFCFGSVNLHRHRSFVSGEIKTCSASILAMCMHGNKFRFSVEACLQQTQNRQVIGPIYCAGAVTFFKMQQGQLSKSVDGVSRIGQDSGKAAAKPCIAFKHIAQFSSQPCGHYLILFFLC